VRRGHQRSHTISAESFLGSADAGYRKRLTVPTWPWPVADVQFWWPLKRGLLT